MDRNDDSPDTRAAVFRKLAEWIDEEPTRAGDVGLDLLCALASTATRNDLGPSASDED